MAAPHGSHEFQALYALWLREFKVFLREKSRVVSSVATPLILVAVVGTGFGATTEFTDPRYAAFSYEQFMFPGILAMSILFGTMFFGLNIVMDRKMDVLKEVLVAPVSRTTIFFGKVLGGCSESVVQAVLLLALGVLLFGVAPQGALLALGYAVLLAVSFVSVGLFLGSFFESYEGFQLIGTFVMFPVFFLSGALYPIEGLPGWLAVLTRLNPASYAVDGLRGSLLGVWAFHPLLDVAVLAAFALLFVGLGTWAFRRMT